LPLNIGSHKWLRLLGLVLLLYLVFLPVWWAALTPLTAFAAACADVIYRLFDSSVSIAADGRIARVNLTGGGELAQSQESGLRMETVTYGMPMLASLIVATRAAGALSKLEALSAGLAIMTALTVLAVLTWARLAGLEAYDQMMFEAKGVRGHTSSFVYYAFHGYAFCQPVAAVLLWMGTSMSGVFDGHGPRAPKGRDVDPKSPCRCGSGRQYRRCCGKTARRMLTR
jgi:hypothetical protein